MTDQERKTFTVKPFIESVCPKHSIRWIPVRCRVGDEDLLPWETIQTLQDVMEYGKDRGKEGWDSMEADEQVERAVRHGLGYLSGDTTDEHLTHLFCRAMFAVATERGE